MTRRLSISLGVTGLAVIGSLLASSADSAQVAPGGKDFKPATTVHLLMEGQGMVFVQIRDALSNAETPHRYQIIEAGAGVLAELANVNTLNSEKEDYRGWAGELRDTAMALAQEADKKAAADEGKLSELFNQMKSKCAACHDVYQD
jgi:hypothetical protein